MVKYTEKDIKDAFDEAGDPDEDEQEKIKTWALDEHGFILDSTNWGHFKKYLKQKRRLRQTLRSIKPSWITEKFEV